MFFGQYTHQLDSKDRLTVPARYRTDLEGGAFVLQGFERNLIVIPRPAFEIVRANLSRLSLTDETARLLRRKFFSSAEEMELDKSGRLLLPQFLRQYAGLSGEVVLAGAGDYFEIWSPAAWSDQAEKLQDVGRNAAGFAEFDIFTAAPPEKPGAALVGDSRPQV